MVVVLLSCSVTLAGCAYLQNYTVLSQQARMSLAVGNYPDALSVFPESSARGKDEILIRMERGVILQAMGRFEDSANEFERAVRKIRDSENRAVISASRTAAQAGTLIVNEQVLPYDGEDFEKVLIHALNAVNYVLGGDLDGARVEILNAYRRQDELAEKHARDLMKAEENLADADWERSFQKTDREGFEALREKAQSVLSIYQNAFAYYVSALVYELNREENDAYIDLKKAIRAAPGCRSIQQDLIRLSRELNFREDAQEWVKQFGEMEIESSPGIDVFVIFTFGLAPFKEAVSFPIPIGKGGFVFASLPVYRFTPTTIHSGKVLGGGTSVETSLLSDTDAIAARNLLDKFPILFAKQIARSYLKAQASRSLSREYGALGALAGTVASAVTEQADLRTWSSLPKEIHVARVFLPGSTRRFLLKAFPSGPQRTVELPEGTRHCIVLSRVTDTDMTVHTRAY